MRNSKLPAFLLTGLLFACVSAQAQMKAQYFSPESFSAPERLGPVGGKIPAQKNVFYVRESAFGFEPLDAGKTRLKVPATFAGSVYVKFDSELVTQAINAALTAKGVKLAERSDDADVSVFGQGIYRVHLMPFLQRQLRLDTKFDQFKKTVSIADAETKKIGAGDALVSVGSSAVNAAVNPAEFLGRLIESTMDLTGATSAMERATGWSDRQRGEQSITFGDCYDNSSRMATCPAGAARNNAYTFRTRFQYVDFKTSVSGKAIESQKFNLIARSIDGRTETKDDMNELMSMAISELVAGFPTVGGDTPKADSNVQAQ
jgi:hypothetical protein